MLAGLACQLGLENLALAVLDVGPGITPQENSCLAGATPQWVAGAAEPGETVPLQELASLLATEM